MDVFQFLNTNLQNIGTFIVAAFLLWDKFFSGSLRIRKEIAADYKERNQQLEDKIKELSGKLDTTNLRLAGMEATLVEKDKHIASLTEILQGKNPEIEKVLTDIRDFMQKLNTINTKQIKILEKQQKRDQRIDKETAKQ